MGKVKKFDEFFGSSRKNFYGTPTLQQKLRMEAPDALLELYNASGLKNKHFNMPYPSDEESKKEILHMIEDQKLIYQKQDPYHVSLILIEAVEKDHAGVWCKWLKSHGVDWDKNKIRDFMDSTDGILYTIKYHYQRPRPFQFAYTQGVDFFPLISTDANSPSYPSGHAIDAYKMAYVVGKKIPEIKKEASEFSEKTAYTRIVAGLHFPSDDNFSRIIFDDLIKAGIIDEAIKKYLD